jgi:RNA polymerase sigma-70 factor (ECF subfamily)
MAENNKREQTSAGDIPRHALHHLQEEEELVQAMKAGDGDALRVIFDRYHRLVLVTALRIVHDIGEAEDLMQSIFFEVFQKAAQFDPSKGTLGKWILQYAYHRSINRKAYLSLRHFYNAVDFLDSDGEEIWITKVSLPAQEAARLVRELLAVLNCQQREVIERVFLGEMSLREIAEETKQNLGTVRNHYYRGLKKLRNVLSRNNNHDKDGIATYNEQVGRANA